MAGAGLTMTRIISGSRRRPRAAHPAGLVDPPDVATGCARRSSAGSSTTACWSTRTCSTSTRAREPWDSRRRAGGRPGSCSWSRDRKARQGHPRQHRHGRRGRRCVSSTDTVERALRARPARRHAGWTSSSSTRPTTSAEEALAGRARRARGARVARAGGVRRRRAVDALAPAVGGPRGSSCRERSATARRPSGSPSPRRRSGGVA